MRKIVVLLFALLVTDAHIGKIARIFPRSAHR